MQIAERPDDLLHVVPRRHAGLDFGLQGLRDIHSVGPPVWTPEAQGEMRAMLGPVGTVASGSPTAAIRLGQGAKHDARGQLVKPSEEGGPRRASGRHRCHQ
jgi:hypothetical protein